MPSETYLIDGIAYRFFSGYARKNRPEYFDLEMSLKKANINVPLDIYVSRMFFISFLAGAAVAASMVMTLALIMLTAQNGTFLPWAPVTNGNLLVVVASSPYFFAFAVTVAAFFAAFVSSYLLYRNYPLYRANIRESNINQMLPHAVTFMYAMSNGGMNLLEIFRTMNSHSDIYGEVAVELEIVIRGVDLLGLDLITSIKQASLITASEPLRNFFDSLAANMGSGGDLSKFLHSRSDQFQVVASQERKAMLEMLSMMAEVYVTAFVAGPLFLITILISLGMISSSDPRQIEILVYLLVPAGSILFVWLLTALGLGSDENRPRMIGREMDEFREAHKVPVSTPDVSRALRWAEKRYGIKKFIDNPAHSFINHPHNVLYISIPVAVIVFAILARSFGSIPGQMPSGFPDIGTISRLDDVLLIALAIAFVPFIVFWEVRTRRIKKMEAAIPEFLKRLASYNESGLTLTLAIKSMLNSNLGVLTSEIRKIWTDIEWGADTREALMRFEYRVNTASIRRVVTLITKASESSGDIKETLSIAAADATAGQNDREDRVLSMMLYISIIYISFFVFLYIVYTLSTVFLPMVPGHGFSTQAAGTTASSAMTLGGTIDVGLYRLIFMHAVLIQGLFSGLVAGMMSEGNLNSGLKHSAIMMLIGYGVFALLL